MKAFEIAETATSADDLVSFVNSKQGYRIDRPTSWEQTSKAGADVLFTDPAKKSTTVGVTVSPIRIAGLEQFGDVETVRTKLVNTEKAKVHRSKFCAKACIMSCCVTSHACSNYKQP